MSKIIKRRQLVLAALAVALGTAMLVNWYYTRPTTGIGKNIDKETISETGSANLGEAQYVSGTNGNTENDYFAEAILKRSGAYDEARSALSGVIESENADKESREKAVEELGKLTQKLRLEAEVESLITAKTNGKCFVCVGDTVEVVVQKGTLGKSVVTQIKEIVMNKTKAPGEKIIIIEAK